MFFNIQNYLPIKKNLPYVKEKGVVMSRHIERFSKLISEAKKAEGKSPLEALKSFVHFLKEMKSILSECAQEEREKIFMEFQKHQKEFEHSLKSLQFTEEQMKDPEKMESIKHQLESGEFKVLIKEMSDTLFAIVKIMSEGKV